MRNFPGTDLRTHHEHPPISTETLESSPGSIAQVRECSASILRFAKETHTAVILIGHINKEGSIAGPKVLEHIVDTVLLPNWVFTKCGKMDYGR